jgi:hypothetical protein
MKNRKQIHDNWRTPPEYYDKWNLKYGFDCDPCPYNNDFSKYDGLKDEWGDRNYVNPPYSRKIKEAFVKKAVELKDTALSFLLLPVSTSTILFHQIIKPNAIKIELLEKRIRFIGINDKGQLVNYDQITTTTKETIEYNDPIKGLIEIPKYINNSGQFDSMTVLI